MANEQEEHDRLSYLRGFKPLERISTETHLRVGQTVVIDNVAYTLKRSSRHGLFLDKQIKRKGEA
jgi:hypothetical protein